MSERITVPVELLEKAAKHVGDLACVVMSYNGGTTNTLLDFEDELRSVLSAARTAPAERGSICRFCGKRFSNAEDCGNHVDHFHGGEIEPAHTAPDALQAEVSKNKLLRAQLETVRMQRDKELKEKCEALNDVERLKAEAQFLIERLSSLEFTDMDDLVRDWYGHVVPSLSRLQALTAKPEVDHE
ncbi:DUF629 domain-containing protein [Pseudomonas luteola]|uniref:DUF629 domain-containing protein n=1 Tax=Pseudomonas luteola TaxID=47886 RepID=UPI00123B90EC|nr:MULTISPECIES: DUF629 domain-containing protein [Pseudomonas]MBA1249899.1 DUF629 domain-containing protein [Pseudomonas zeshuii]QEU28803.1 DUF629 domain-containing protein [Pseudomonas luteola]QEU28870.1 DUF629 domain-containing protein [Pseudomonas luteola]